MADLRHDVGIVVRRLALACKQRPLPACFVVYGALYISWLSLSQASEATRSIVANLGYLPVGLASALLAWQVSVHPALTPRLRAGWRLLVIASLLTLTGDILWTIEENLLGIDPSDSWINIAYFLYYVTLLAGLLCFPQVLRSRRDALKFGLDAATVMVGGAMLVAYFVIGPTLAANSSTLALVISIGYPIGDLLLLLGVSTLLLRCAGGRRRRPMLLLAASMSAMMIGDVVWASLSLNGDFRAGNTQDLLFMAQYVLFALAVTEERSRLASGADAEADAAVQPLAALPYLAIASGYGVLLYVARQGTPQLFLLTVGAVALTLLVIGRQVLALQENMRLSHERTLLESEARFRSLIQNASDLVSIIDENWQFVFVSPSAALTLGREPATLVGTSFLDIVHPEDVAIVQGRLGESLAQTGRSLTARWRLGRTDGTWIHTDNICTNLMHDKNVSGLVLNSRNVSEQYALEAKLMHQAFHDPLTGLANRSLFENRVEHALTRQGDGRDSIGVLFVDLDHFKNVNDSLGHAAGDRLLEAAAIRLQQCLRPSDTVARLGGDEFAVLVDPASRSDVMDVAERVARAFGDPFWIGGNEIVASASVGAALAVDGQRALELLRNADLAMYLAKSRGRGQVAWFEAEMHEAALDQLRLVADLRHALERNELSLVYQPIHRLECGTLTGFEALLRWKHPVRGDIPPTVFIPVAEETGLIVPIGTWVTEQACRQASVWQARYRRTTPLKMTINLSSRQVLEPTLIDSVRAALTGSNVAPGSVVLELTESLLLQHTDHVIRALDSLKALGVRLAIDDFGTGYSSLSYLQRLPIDIVKIDRAFIDRIEHDASASALASAIVGLGSSLSLQTVGEGIENVRQANMLRALGCDFGQGYYYSAPLMPTDLEDYAEHALAARAA